MVVAAKPTLAVVVEEVRVVKDVKNGALEEEGSALAGGWTEERALSSFDGDSTPRRPSRVVTRPESAPSKPVR